MPPGLPQKRAPGHRHKVRSRPSGPSEESRATPPGAESITSSPFLDGFGDPLRDARYAAPATAAQTRNAAATPTASRTRRLLIEGDDGSRRRLTRCQSGAGTSPAGASNSSSARITLSVSTTDFDLLEHQADRTVSRRKRGADGSDLDADNLRDAPVIEVGVIAEKDDQT